MADKFEDDLSSEVNVRITNISQVQKQKQIQLKNINLITTSLNNNTPSNIVRGGAIKKIKLTNMPQNLIKKIQQAKNSPVSTLPKPSASQR